MTDSLRMYTTVAGELVSLVENKIPKCFVEYEQYLELKKQYDLLESNYQDQWDCNID